MRQSEEGWLGSGLSCVLSWLHGQSSKETAIVHFCRSEKARAAQAAEHAQYARISEFTTVKINQGGEIKGLKSHRCSVEHNL